MENNQKIQEMQVLEQTLQNILLQKQAFQMELSETKTAIEAIKDSGDEVYKIVGQLMIKSKRDSINEDLLNKKKILDLRMQNLEKQEESLTSQLEEIREEVMSKNKN